jgi:hypothetical protein
MTPMAITAGVLLGAYLLALVYVLVAPVKQRDPAMGAAQGCLAAMVLVLLVLGALLAVGVTRQVGWLTIAIFVITIAPFAWMALGAPVYVYMRLKRRREARQWQPTEAAPPPAEP